VNEVAGTEPGRGGAGPRGRVEEKTTAASKVSQGEIWERKRVSYLPFPCHFHSHHLTGKMLREEKLLA